MNNVVLISVNIGHRTPDEWRSYISEATEMERAADQSKVEAIIEKGRRIAEFHAFYNKHKNGLGKSWKEACKNIVGVDQPACSRYETIADTLMSNGHNSVLPPDYHSLYDLARAVSSNRKTFDDAIAGGEINPTMSRDEAKAVARRAAAAASHGGVRTDKRHPEMIALHNAGHNAAQIAKKLGMTTGNPREDKNARIRVARELRSYGLGSNRKSPLAGKPKSKGRAGFSMAQRGVQIKEFWDGQPKGEERAGLDPSQRVHLFAFTVKQMLDAQAATHELAIAVLKAASDQYPDAARFCELIDQMLEWKPDKSRKGTGWDTDFAAKAKKTLNSLDKHLDKAVERLTALQAQIKARKVQAVN